MSATIDNGARMTFHHRLRHAVLVFSLLALTIPAMAQSSRYIRDELYVPLRSGQGLEYRIINKGLPSGTRLTLLETNESSGWSRVRTSSGAEGWIETQYLTDQPVAKDLLERANKELAKLRENNGELRQQLQTVRSDSNATGNELEKFKQENERLNTELDELKRISGNAVKLDRDNKQLLQTNEMLRNQLEVVQTDNQRLRDSDENEAFLNGAIAVIIGVMIALVVPRLWPKRKSEWA